MSIVSDPFTRTQPNGTILPADGSWNPFSGTRQLSVNNDQTASNSINNGFNISLTQVNSEVYLSYRYDTAQNLSAVSEIMLDEITITTFISARAILTIIDSNNNFFQVTKTILENTTSLTWSKSEFPNVNFNQITRISFQIVRNNGSASPLQMRIGLLKSTVLCLAYNTEILMINGTIKLIQDLIIGDMVASGDYVHGLKITKILQIKLSGNYLPDIVHFAKDAIGYNLPTKSTFTTALHPILYQNKRKPAKCFHNLNNCTWYNFTTACKDLLPMAPDGFYYLYNLQFSTEGLFIANGLIVQAVSP